ncbi:hypothetical protein [Paenibacillus tengchongensis]|uniref:hypothetical protein n=1 Tax=Paenibacillus tengchongensis TaxID=2608684 RepID=UPI00124F0411|nr:hypothetical protein [Paenibacillus tengchongensis]
MEYVFIMLLNIAFCAIMPWFLIYSYAQYKLKKKGRDPVYVYDQARMIPHIGLLVFIALYVAAVTVLWVLYILGLNDWITGHWFSYVYPLVLPIAVNHNRVVLIIDHRGIITESTTIAMEEITGYELKDWGAAGGRQSLEIQAGERMMRGWIRPESAPAVITLLEADCG